MKLFLRQSIKSVNSVRTTTGTRVSSRVYTEYVIPGEAVEASQQSQSQRQRQQQESINLPMYDAPKLVDDDDMKHLLMQKGISIVFLGLAGTAIYAIFSQSSVRHRLLLGKKKSAVDPQSVKENFEDVAGLENAKLELQEVIEFLKNPDKFAVMGAKIPKGCLLVGGPGLGKTLLARAIAGEAGVPFFASSASEFIELFVGTGAARVRELFKSAVSNAPCIIFIDEIDAVGKARSGNTFGSNDEREQTINQLLIEMDGFTQNTGVIVIASTNRPDILDKALVRPGRFDRIITLDPPTIKDRQAILKVHCANKPLSPSVSLSDIAQATPGLSGAELANVANEAAILATRSQDANITQEHFMAAIDRVILGPERTNTFITPKRKKLVACHEAGHTIMALCLHGDIDEISKVSIIPRGRTGGVTMFLPTQDNTDIAMYSQKYLENKLIIALGGRAAEDIVFGDSNVTTGSSNDLEVVQSIARAMITSYGFNKKLGPSAWSDVSPITSHQIDKEVSTKVKKAYEKAKNIINNNFELFNAIAEALYTKEELTKKDLEDLYMQTKKN